MWISYRPKCCGLQHLGLYKIHMPKHRNPQHRPARDPRNPQAAVVICGKRRRFQVANASDRLHCDNVPKPSSRRLFLIACAQSYRESRLARNVTVYNYTPPFNPRSIRVTHSGAYLLYCRILTHG